MKNYKNYMASMIVSALTENMYLDTSEQQRKRNERKRRSTEHQKALRDAGVVTEHKPKKAKHKRSW